MRQPGKHPTEWEYGPDEEHVVSVLATIIKAPLIRMVTLHCQTRVAPSHLLFRREQRFDLFDHLVGAIECQNLFPMLKYRRVRAFSVRDNPHIPALRRYVLDLSSCKIRTTVCAIAEID